MTKLVSFLLLVTVLSSGCSSCLGDAPSVSHDPMPIGAALPDDELIDEAAVEEYKRITGEIISFFEDFGAEYIVVIRELSGDGSCGILGGRVANKLDTLCKSKGLEHEEIQARAQALEQKFGRDTIDRIARIEENKPMMEAYKQRIEQKQAELEEVFSIAGRFFQRCPGQRPRIQATMERCRWLVDGL